MDASAFDTLAKRLAAPSTRRRTLRGSLAGAVLAAFGFGHATRHTSAVGNLPCSVGLTLCGDVCVDLSSDMGNCGACGAVCESGLVPVECRSGVCERANCPVGIAYCGAVDGCRDLTSDPSHCGACQHPCPSGICLAGVCAA